jgi:hypothetical protein
VATNPEKPELKVIFAPGCFDDFEGTQEELAEFIAQIHQMAASGELAENSTPVDFDDLDDEDLKRFENITTRIRQ